MSTFFKENFVNVWNALPSDKKFVYSNY